MSADTKGKKRKSGDDVVPAAKKAKTSAPKSAPKPETVKPLKSALKKTKPDIAVAPAKKPTKSTAVVPDPPKDEVALAKTETKKASKPSKAKASKSEPKAAEAETIVDEEEDDNATELTADQTAALLAGFSSDEEEEEDAGLDIAKIPAAPVPAKDKKKRASKGGETDDSENTPGTIYIGRLPHGFFERQLHAYYNQFGAIKNLRLARNKRTGKSQHHAFIEFASAAVADIVVKTMDKYLLFGHIMQVRRVPAEAVNEKMWKSGRSVKGGRVMPRNRIERSHLKRGADREKWEQRVERENNRRKEKSEQLKELGYEFEMPEVKKVSAVPVKPKAIEASAEEKVSEEVVESRVIDDLGPTVVEETTTITEEEKPGVVTTTVKKNVKRKSKTAEAPAVKKSKKAKTASAA
jgi:nucleolar protein 15